MKLLGGREGHGPHSANIFHPHKGPSEIINCICACVLSGFRHVHLCDPMDQSPPGSSAYGIVQARILEQVAIPFSRGSSQSRNQTHVSYVSCTGRQVLYH